MPKGATESVHSYVEREHTKFVKIWSSVKLCGAVEQLDKCKAMWSNVGRCRAAAIPEMVKQGILHAGYIQRINVKAYFLQRLILLDSLPNIQNHSPVSYNSILLPLLS